MKNKSILFLTCLFVVSCFVCGFLMSHIHQLEAEVKIWQEERYRITSELDQFRKHFKKFHEIVKQSGLTPFYQETLELEQPDSSSDIYKKRMDFNLNVLNLLDQNSFSLVFDGVLKEFRKILHSSYKDIVRLTKNDRGLVKAEFLSSIPSVWPTEGKISSLFGMRLDPILKREKFHSGVDISNLKSTDIVASAQGKVIFSGKKGDYGKTVIIDHENGYSTLYAHAEQLVANEDDVVEKGEVIAEMGSTGRSTGPHLHYEIRFQAELLDPSLFVN